MTPDNEIMETIERFQATRREGPTLGELVWALPQFTRTEIDASVSRLIVAQGLSETRAGRLALDPPSSSEVDNRAPAHANGVQAL